MSDSKEMIAKAIAELGLTFGYKFVPWSQSRAKDDKEMNHITGKESTRPRRSLNWVVTLKRNGRTVLVTDYGAGIGHCPAYQASMTNDVADCVAYECEHGHKSWIFSGGVVSGREPILPKDADVLYGLISDASVIDAGDFAEWASDLGYDSDSRKAEQIYRACLDIALKLRNGLGEAGLRKLQEALQGY